MFENEMGEPLHFPEISGGGHDQRLLEGIWDTTEHRRSISALFLQYGSRNRPRFPHGSGQCNESNKWIGYC